MRQYSTDSSGCSTDKSTKSWEHVATGSNSVSGAGPSPSGRRSGAVEALKSAGWSRAEVLNVPNALSMLRLLSGPIIASWILDAQVGSCT